MQTRLFAFTAAFVVVCGSASGELQALETVDVSLEGSLFTGSAKQSLSPVSIPRGGRVLTGFSDTLDTAVGSRFGMRAGYPLSSSLSLVALAEWRVEEDLDMVSSYWFSNGDYFGGVSLDAPDSQRTGLTALGIRGGWRVGTASTLQWQADLRYRDQDRYRYVLQPPMFGPSGTEKSEKSATGAGVRIDLAVPLFGPVDGVLGSEVSLFGDEYAWMAEAGFRWRLTGAH